MRVCCCFSYLTLNPNVTLRRFPMTEYMRHGLCCFAFFYVSHKFCIFSRFLFTVLIFGWKQKFSKMKPVHLCCKRNLFMQSEFNDLYKLPEIKKKLFHQREVNETCCRIVPGCVEKSRHDDIRSCRQINHDFSTSSITCFGFSCYFVVFNS